MSSEFSFRARFIWIRVESSSFHWSKDRVQGPSKCMSLMDLTRVDKTGHLRHRPLNLSSHAAQERCVSIYWKDLSAHEQGIDLLVRTI